MAENTDINVLLDKPVWQMTGAELCTLMRHALTDTPSAGPAPKKEIAVGVNALAQALACSQSKIYALMRTPHPGYESTDHGGILHEAIVSRIGRRICFDIELARKLANRATQDKQ